MRIEHGGRFHVALNLVTHANTTIVVTIFICTIVTIFKHTIISSVHDTNMIIVTIITTIFTQASALP